jgi:DNA-binding winged helix-turn-helix (wHTH) protein/TolB-like protein
MTHQEAAVPERLRFGVFELDLRARALRRGGARIHLQAQPFAALALLASRPGQLVSRDTLCRHIWGEDSPAAVDHGLNYCLRQVRLALGDKPRSARYVETLPGLGYRFIAPVDGLDAAPPDAPPRAPVPHATPARLEGFRIRGLRSAVACVAALAALAAVLGHAPQATRVLVLPFAPFNGDGGGDAHLHLAVADEAIDDLSRDARHLAVIARSSALAYRATGANPEDAGRRAGADYVLDGVVSRQGRAWRVRAQWTRTEGGVSVWSQTFGARDEEWPRLPGQVAHAAERALAQELRLPGGAAFPDSATIDAATYEDLLLARYRLIQDDPATVTAAVDAFTRVVERAPTYAPAWSGLAQAWSAAARLAVRSPRETLPHAASAARRALSLDPSAAEPHAVLAQVSLHLDWNVGGAQAEFQRALALAPGAAALHHARAAAYAAAGQGDAALASVQRALALDPLNRAVLRDSGWYAYLARRHGEAASLFDRTLRLEPGDMSAHTQALLNARASGQPTMPRVGALLRAAGVRPEQADAIAGAGGVERILTGTARALQRERGRRYVGADEIAVTLACQGDDSAALEWLERAADERAYWLLPTLTAEPCLDRLRATPRLQALLARTRVQRRPLASHQ